MSDLSFILERPEIAKKVTIEVEAEELFELFLKFQTQYAPTQTTSEVITPLEEKLRTVEETSERFGVSRVTLWQWGKKGILNPVKIGHVVRYKESEINHVLSSLRPQFTLKNPKQV